MATEASTGALTRRNRTWVPVLAWFVTITVDFFVYGGVFVFLFHRDDPYLLTTQQPFARIPARYVSFAIEVLILGWLPQAVDDLPPDRGV